MKLWPRLPLPRARVLARKFAGSSAEDLRLLPMTSERLYAPTGGNPIGDSTLRYFRQCLEDAARACGYPQDVGRKERASFDTEVLRFLADYEIPFGEAIRAETWAWINVALVPHLVHWRWPDDAGRDKPDRFAGPLLRNAFGRLWYASVRLDRGQNHPERWEYTEELGADQVVALLERPSLAASGAVSLAVAAAWVSLPHDMRKEELFRETMKTLIMRAGVQRLDVLSPEFLQQTVVESFASTATRLASTIARRG